MAPYSGAPYNFVPLPKEPVKHYEDVTKLPSHAKLDKNLLSGDIEVEITAKSPIFIGSMEGSSFYRDAQGRFAIPGSSFRGLIRNNMQILSAGYFGDDFEDYKLMYRKVGAASSDPLVGTYKDELNVGSYSVDNGDKKCNISVTKNVKAGYILCKNGKYFIAPSVVEKIDKDHGDSNFYPLRETTIFKAYVHSLKGGDNPYELLKKSDKDTVLQHIGRKFDRIVKNGRVHIVGTPNPDYEPFYFPISYDIKNLKDIIAVGKPHQYSKEGYIISTGKMNEKKTVYIIPQICDENEESYHKIPDLDIKSFRQDYKNKENQLKGLFPKSKNPEHFFGLPKEGDIKPVFYIYHEGRLFFGFTPYLRLLYTHSISDGIPAAQKSKLLDYTASMLGFISNDTSGYKSRIFFEDLPITQKSAVMDEQELVLASPKASSYMDYLNQGKKTYTYNDEEFQIRGIKQYWLTDALRNPVGPIKENCATKFQPLNQGAIFKGQIHFKNLTLEELGLLFWAVSLEEDSEQNIGKGKPYGYGRISSKICSYRLLDFDQMYAPERLNFAPYHKESKSVSEVIKAFKDKISEELKKNITETPFVSAFLLMKDHTKVPNNEKTEYMKLPDYRNRTTPLPTVKSVLKEETEKKTVKQPSPDVQEVDGLLIPSKFLRSGHSRSENQRGKNGRRR